jgi:hypothetical protein
MFLTTETKVTKIVYNNCFGGFGLSEAAWKRYVELGGKARDYWDVSRADPILVQVVEELGEDANTRFSELAIADIPEGTKYRIDEYDGSESVMTVDDYNWSVA